LAAIPSASLPSPSGQLLRWLVWVGDVGVDCPPARLTGEFRKESGRERENADVGEVGPREMRGLAAVVSNCKLGVEADEAAASIHVPSLTHPARRTLT